MQREASSSRAYLLLDYVQRLERHREGRRAVHIHLSKLKAQKPPQSITCALPKTRLAN